MIYALIATVFVSLISLVGALVLFNSKFIKGFYSSIMISLAAGVMLTTAVLDLLPEALKKSTNQSIYWSLLAGICIFFVLERLIFWYHHHAHGHKKKDEIEPSAYLVLLGDGLHNFFDGLAIAASFSVNWRVGIVATIAIIIHEVLQELADFVVLINGGFSTFKALFYNLLSGVTAILGVFVGWYFINNEGILPYLLAFNSGMFIYISCSDLIPALHEDFKKKRKWLQTFTFIMAVIAMIVLMNVINPDSFDDKLYSNDGSAPIVKSVHLEAEN